MGFWNDIILPALRQIVAQILAILPNVLAALAILIVGWIVARLVDSVVTRVLQRLGFNRMAERAGIGSFMKNAGFTQEPSWVVGKLMFWLLMLTFVLSSAEMLHLTMVAETLQKLVAFLPNVIAVIFMVVFGALFARFVSRLTRGAAKEAGLDIADFLSKLVNYLIIIMVVVIAINQLEIQSSVLEIAFAALLGAFALAIALTLGIGTQSVAQNIISGVYARRMFRVGDSVRINHTEGQILEIGTVSTRIRNAEDIVSLPNKMLINEVALRRRDKA